MQTITLGKARSYAEGAETPLDWCKFPMTFFTEARRRL